MKAWALAVAFVVGVLAALIPAAFWLKAERSEWQRWKDSTGAIVAADTARLGQANRELLTTVAILDQRSSAAEARADTATQSRKRTELRNVQLVDSLGVLLVMNPDTTAGMRTALELIDSQTETIAELKTEVSGLRDALSLQKAAAVVLRRVLANDSATTRILETRIRELEARPPMPALPSPKRLLAFLPRPTCIAGVDVIEAIRLGLGRPREALAVIGCGAKIF